MTSRHESNEPTKHRLRTRRHLRLAGLALLWIALACPPCRVDAAGPETTSRLLATANALARRPLTERIKAYRTVLTARKRLDVNAFRALRKMATIFGKAQDPHAKAATVAWSMVRHAKNERGTYKARLRLATTLRSEGDLDAAHALFRVIIEDGTRVAPDAVARALRDLSQDAFDRGQIKDVRALVRQAERARADPITQMTLLGRLGELTFRRGDYNQARALCTRCRKQLARAQREDLEIARKATKAWLDLPLRRVLTDVR